MSEHRTHLFWKKGAEAFAYETYSRTHHIATGNGLRFEASSAPEYKGDATLTNPEELLVAAISSCHMLTFLAVAAKKGFTVVSYEDQAEGILERLESGPIHVTRAILRPVIAFEGNTPDAETLAKLHDQAHRGCFIANSVKTVVTVEAPA